jgi:hypothetical protein
VDTHAEEVPLPWRLKLALCPSTPFREPRASRSLCVLTMTATEPHPRSNSTQGFRAEHRTFARRVRLVTGHRASVRCVGGRG